MEEKALPHCTLGRAGGRSLMPRWAFIAPGCTEQLKLPPLLQRCLPEPRQPSEALRLPCSTDCVLLRKAKEKFPKRKVHPEPLSLAAEFLGWRILELFTFLTPLR